MSARTDGAIAETATGTREMHFHAPGFKRFETGELAQRDRRQFVAVSLTGTACSLSCDHCNGELLRWMRPAARDGLFETCRRLAADGAKGILVSGGSDRRGRVPLAAFGEELSRVKRELGLQVLVHTGLLDRAGAGALASAQVDGALIDVIGTRETIRDVYHLDAWPEDFARSLAFLADFGIPALPHIVMGLHYGRFLGEEEALDIVAGSRIAGLVLVALTPLLGTRMAGYEPPSVQEMTAFMERARGRLPGIPLLLGCARPGGEAKPALDRAAIELGFQGIAYPAEGSVAAAREAGFASRFHETCCGVPWLLGGGA